MAFKKGDTLVCVINETGGILWRLTVGRNYKATQNESDGNAIVVNDSGCESRYPSECFALAGGHIELESEPMRVSIELSVIETCVELLDEIRKPTVQYHRDPRILMQSVIDTNSSNAELVANYLKRCLPKNGERG